MDVKSEQSIRESVENSNLRLAQDIDEGNLPESFDWRTTEDGKYASCITQAENQGGCGSC
jgi:hypothetical protein